MKGWRFGVVAAVTLLLWAPVAVPAQRDSGWETGRRQMEEWMWSERGPTTRKQEQAEKPGQAVPPAGPTTPTMPATPGMTGPMEHPPASPPFYRERTFLVLVGVAVAGGGVVAYRAARSRRRRRPAPAAFMTEAVLVVDLVSSTRLATHYGNGLAMQARNILKERTLAAAEPRGLKFAENTGDGYLMTFSSVVGAVETATTLLKDLRDRPPDLSPGPTLEVRAGISYGEILLDAQGGRHAAAINKGFRLQGLSQESFAQIEGASEPSSIPDRNRILLDEEAAHEVQAAGIPLRFLGFANLKGFSGLHRVYEVLWETRE